MLWYVPYVACASHCPGQHLNREIYRDYVLVQSASDHWHGGISRVDDPLCICAALDSNTALHPVIRTYVLFYVGTYTVHEMYKS